MTKPYDNFYKTENLFGEAYPELLAFFSNYPNKGKVLDLGCGQGRDALALARLGFNVTGIDSSKVGIAQMAQIAKTEELQLSGLVTDIYSFDDFSTYDFVLLDNMFHFDKKDRAKETAFITKILDNVKQDCIVVFCIQDSGKKVSILNDTLETNKDFERITDLKYKYVYTDGETGHSSTSDYRLVAVKK